MQHRQHLWISRATHVIGEFLNKLHRNTREERVSLPKPSAPVVLSCEDIASGVFYLYGGGAREESSPALEERE
jgi:hypothetical protein